MTNVIKLVNGVRVMEIPFQTREDAISFLTSNNSYYLLQQFGIKYILESELIKKGL